MNPKVLTAMLLVLSCLQNHLYSESCPKDLCEYVPLYAGTQLAFYASNSAPGRLSVQPFFYGIRQYGTYNKKGALHHQPNIDQAALLLALETGITQSLDISLILDASYSKFKNKHSYLYGDTEVYLGWQPLHDRKGSLTPDLRLLLGESFPTGKYDHLNLSKGGSDSLGTGAYETSLLCVIAKTFYVFARHPFNLNINLFYIFSSNVSVNGFNRYGGGVGTRGKVKPGNQAIVNLSIQYSLNRYWVAGTDIRYVHQNKSPFAGVNGRFADSSIAKTGLPSSEQFSLAPCVEYNWNENFSVAAGAWLTVAGRNTFAFVDGIANVYYYF